MPQDVYEVDDGQLLEGHVLASDQTIVSNLARTDVHERR